MTSVILVVDDNAANLRLACDVLESEPFTVLQAESAEQALAVIARDRPDLILMDLSLPGMDGLTLTRRLKADERTRAIVIVALTASAMRGDEERVRAAGCDGYITKPIDTRRFGRQVTAYLEASRRPGRDGPRVVLVVDDNATNRRLLRAMLESDHMQVLEAGDGVEALAILETSPVDLIISDVLMPRMDGYRFCLELRKNTRFQHLPLIIYTSTYTTSEDEHLALTMGADRYFVKPTPPAQLLAAVHALDIHRESALPTDTQAEHDLLLLEQYSQQLVGKLEQRNVELARTSAELVSAHERLRHLLARSPAVLYGLGVAAGRPVMHFVSENVANLLGFTVSEALAEGWWERQLHPEDRERALAGLAGTLSNGTRETDYRLLHKDGTYRWLRDSRSLVRDATGQPCEIVGVWIDISEQRQLEEALRQAQKIEAIGQLAGGIAHDFNNILGCIIGYAELLAKDTGDPKNTDAYLREVLKASERAQDLVRQILTFSRRHEQERKSLAPAAVVGDALKMLRALLPSTIEIQASIPDNLPTVLADATQLQQIVLNLGTNSAHAMQGRGRLEVALAAIDVDQGLANGNPDLRPGPYVRLSVTDTGCGMDRETLLRVFEPFFTTKPQGEGTGLGLAVVHGIVHSHDGAITVESTPGQGTIFQVYLPAHADPPAAPEPVAGAPQRGGGEHVLFVDDEPQLAALGKQVLERAGYRVTALTSPVEALAVFRAGLERVDLAVVDLTMPRMTGADLARELLQLAPDLPIVLATGFSGMMTADRAQALGIREILQKPVTSGALTGAVFRALHAARGPRP